MARPRHLRPNGRWCARCERRAVGKSRYCATHRSEARKAYGRIVAERIEEARARREEAALVLSQAEERASQLARAMPFEQKARVKIPGNLTIAKVGLKDGTFVNGRGVWLACESVSYAYGFAQTLRDHGIRAKLEARP